MAAMRCTSAGVTVISICSIMWLVWYVLPVLFLTSVHKEPVTSDGLHNQSTNNGYNGCIDIKSICMCQALN